MKDNYILGIFCYFHDASACLLHNGKLVAMAEEERFTRKKHCGNFPEQAIRHCLKTANIDMSDIDCTAYGFKPLQFILHQAGLFIKNFPKSLNLFHKGASEISFLSKINNFVGIRGQFRKMFGHNPQKLFYVDHHLAHAYSTYFVSPFDEAAILIADGFGEVNATSVYSGVKDNIKHFNSIPYPNSLGMYYGAVTQYLGFQPENDEYKVMGLCAYGKNRFKDAFNKILKTNGEMSYKLDERYFDLVTHGTRRWFSSEMEKILGQARRYEDSYEQKHFDIAHSAQSQLENVMRTMGRALQAKTKSRKLCLAGGIAQNILMNRVLLEDCGFDDIFVPPVAYGGGISLGSALVIYREHFKGKREFVLNSSSWGPRYSVDECVKVLTENNLSFDQEGDLSCQIANIIADGNIVGYFHGAMEIGPRALGNRSILADPRQKNIKDILNSRIKKREFFRPFAAMVTQEDAQTYFDVPVESPFMTICGKVKTPEILPGIVHNDGTSRIQTVRKDVLPEIYALLEQFKKLTGVPVLLNTSFNENEPIVCTPQEAIDCFQRTHMDVLVFNNQLLVSK